MLAARVLEHYSSALQGRLEPVSGGFSGARVWRLYTPAGGCCLRAGAPHETIQQVQQRHRLMSQAREAGLTFVPRVFQTLPGTTWVHEADRIWELLEWMPGQADFRLAPTEERLCDATRALARLHRVWSRDTRLAHDCPAIQRRLDGVKIHGSIDNPLLRRWLPRVAEQLRPFRGPFRLQPCLRDVWHDHLLFNGSRLVGIIDYAALGLDTVAVDLARMLGSLLADDEPRWTVALAAYREIAPLAIEEEQLARVLDRTGVIVAWANWRQRLGAATHLREQELRARIQNWDERGGIFGSGTALLSNS